LPGQGLLADFVPSLIELPLKLGNPLLGCMVWGMGGAWRIVGEERLFRGQGMLLANPANRLVGHVGVGMVVFLAPVRLNGSRSVVGGWKPLISVAADESIEVVEA